MMGGGELPGDPLAPVQCAKPTMLWNNDLRPPPRRTASHIRTVSAWGSARQDAIARVRVLSAWRILIWHGGRWRIRHEDQKRSDGPQLAALAAVELVVHS